MDQICQLLFIFKIFDNVKIFEDKYLITVLALQTVHFFRSQPIYTICPANPAFGMFDGFNENMKIILGLSVEDLQLKSFDEWLTS